MAEVSKTSAPPSSAVPVSSKLSQSKRDEIGQALWSTLTQTLGARAEYDDQLVEWNRIYEMQVEEKDFPWEGASNIRLPFSATQLDTLNARLVALVYVPRLYLVEGNTPEAQAVQHDVEQFYNAGLNRYDRRRALIDFCHLGLRDGVSAIDITWRTTKSKRVFEMDMPLMDGGVPAIDFKTGEPKTERKKFELMVTDYDDYEIEVVESRDLIVVPNEAASIEKAMLVARRVMLTEAELLAMCERPADGSEPELWPDAVKRVLATVAEGQSEINQQRQSVETYTAGGLISVTGTVGIPVKAVRQFDRVFSILRVYTRAYDIDGDGWPEEAVAWVHEEDGILLGLSPYKYLHRRRSLVTFAPFRRPNRYLGFSLIGRLQPIQYQIDGLNNARNDQVDIRLSPPRYKKDGVYMDEKNGEWGPNAEYTVGDQHDMGIFELPAIPPNSIEEEQLYMRYAQEYTGLSAPMTGAQNTKQRSAKEAAQQFASAGIRVDLIALELRAANREIFEQINALTKQYGPDVMAAQGAQDNGRPHQLTIDKQKLAQDFSLSVAGFGAPLDQQSRTQERMFVYNLLKDRPYIANDAMKSFKLDQYLLESTATQDLSGIIGTQQEAQQRQQQQAQQAQQEQAFQKHIALLNAQHGTTPPAAKTPQRAQAQHPA